MYNLLIFLLIVNAVMVVLAILMQSDKGGGLSGSAFGGGESLSSTFGSRESANFLNKATIFLVVSFFVLSIAISLMSKIEFNENVIKTNNIIMNMDESNPASKLPPVDGNVLDTKTEKSEDIKLPEPTKKEEGK
ncbi:MAG: preprotein translocase subunit SecG [Candidatus Delongbacteria bacterium]|nr:preprotein translocase subunit SecG [Candidatus Delongbacteria bacterium]MBN2836111.1 preprotein translocase subunit SecG [Candidatus Delongbacteria bacterium]